MSGLLKSRTKKNTHQKREANPEYRIKLEGKYSLAVDEQGMIFLSHGRDKLVHYTTRHTSKCVFRFLADESLWFWITLDGKHGFKEGECSDFRCCWTWKATSYWYSGGQNHIKPWHFTYQRENHSCIVSVMQCHDRNYELREVAHALRYVYFSSAGRSQC